MKQYQLLPQQSGLEDDSSKAQWDVEIVDEDSYLVEESERTIRETRIPSWLRILTYIALLVSIWNLALITIERIHASKACHQRTTKTPSKLRRPNLYPGLERLERNKSSPGWPLTTFTYPRTVNIVNSSNPSGSSDNPTHITIRPGVSTIFEYRISDMDLETCKFGAWFPTSDRARPKSYNISSSTNHVEVWLLTSHSETAMEPNSMTWKNKPPRKTFLGNLVINPGGHSTVLDEYYCKTGSMQLIEVACVGNEDCLIDFTQDTKFPKIGFRMKILEGVPSQHTRGQM